jgi:hypothetical protein
MKCQCQICGAEGPEGKTKSIAQANAEEAGFWFRMTSEMADGRKFPAPLEFCFCAAHAPLRLNDAAHLFMTDAFTSHVREHFPEEHTHKKVEP